MKVLLDSKKPFYKANMHCHSVYSDGHASVETLKEEYKKRGYSIVAFSDHEHLIDNSYLNDDNFLAITSAELAIKEFENESTLVNREMKVVHLNIYAKDAKNTLTPCYSTIYDHFAKGEVKNLIRFDKEYKREYSPKGVNEIIKICNEKGFLVSYNHPTWSLENALDYLNYDNLFAVETYNYGCVRLGILDDEHVFDEFLRAGKKVYCIAGDDNHNKYGFTYPSTDSFGSWTYINAKKLEYNTIMQALINGDFYVSTGPQIFSLVQDGNLVKIKTSNCKKISISTKGRRVSSVIAGENESISQAEFTLNDTDKYFRVRVVDKDGNVANTQAYEV